MTGHGRQAHEPGQERADVDIHLGRFRVPLHEMASTFSRLRITATPALTPAE